jgi:hypothetical protein
VLTKHSASHQIDEPYSRDRQKPRFSLIAIMDTKIDTVCPHLINSVEEIYDVTDSQTTNSDDYLAAIMQIRAGIAKMRKQRSWRSS